MHKHLAPLKIPHIQTTPQKPITKDDTECHNKNPSAPLRKSHSKQDFRKPIVNTSKLPVGFFSVNKTGSPSFSNSPKTKPSNPIVPLKKFLCLEKEQEMGGTPSCFRRKYQDVIVKARESFNQSNSNIEEFVGIRVLSKKENSRKKLVFNAISLKLFVLEELKGVPLEELERIRDLSSQNPNLGRVFQIFSNNSTGTHSLLREFMPGGSLDDLLGFAVSLNERSIDSIMTQFVNVSDSLSEIPSDFGIYFDRKGVLKFQLGFNHSKAPEKRNPKDLILAKCLFGDLFYQTHMVHVTSCCLIHQLCYENHYMYEISTRFSKGLIDSVCPKASKTPRTREFLNSEVDLKDLLRLSVNYSRKADCSISSEDRLQRISNKFAGIAKKNRDCQFIMERINESNRVVKEISQVLGLTTNTVVSQLKEAFGEHKTL